MMKIDHLFQHTKKKHIIKRTKEYTQLADLLGNVISERYVLLRDIPVKIKKKTIPYSGIEGNGWRIFFTLILMAIAAPFGIIVVPASNSKYSNKRYQFKIRQGLIKGITITLTPYYKRYKAAIFKVRGDSLFIKSMAIFLAFASFVAAIVSMLLIGSAHGVLPRILNEHLFISWLLLQAFFLTGAYFTLNWLRQKIIPVNMWEDIPNILAYLTDRWNTIQGKDSIDDPDRDTNLFKAIGDHDIETVKQRIIDGDDINQADKKGMTPLHIAARDGSYDIAELLIACGANLEAKNKKKLTALHLAAKEGDDHIVQLLLESGADPEAVSKSGKTALDIAKSRSQEICVMILKEFMEDASHSGGNKITPRNAARRWIQAVDSGDTARFDALLDEGVPVDSQLANGRTALFQAVKNVQPDIVAILIASGANPNISDLQGTTPLAIAVKSGDMGIVGFLLEHDADINRCDHDGNNALAVAVRNKDMEMIETLADHGVNINTINNRGLTPLDIAISMQNHRIIEQLRGHGAKTGFEIFLEQQRENAA